jgi:O-antigen/teichoic acid export membrane protein
VARERTTGFLQRVARYRRDVANTLSVELVSLVSLAVIFPLTIRSLGDERYGQYTALYLVFGLAGLWVSSAPSAAMVQLILQQQQDSKALLRLARRQALLLAAPVAAIGTLVSFAQYGDDVLLPALAVMTADFLFTSLANLNLAVVFAVTGVGAASRIRLVQPIVRATGVAVLSAAGVLSIGTLVGLNVLTSGLLFAASIWARGRARQEEPSTTPPTARTLFRFSTYYTASMSTNEMQNEGENLVMASTRSAAELGQYAAAYRIVSMTLVPCNAVTGAANRWFMMRDDRTGAQFRRTMRLAVPTALYGVVAGAGILLGRDVIQWIAGSDFDDVSRMAIWLCLLPLLHGLSGLPPMGLLGLGRNRERMIMGFATAAVSVVGYLLLVPRMGWRGGVIGTYISESAAIIAGFGSLRYYQLKADRSAAQIDVTSDEEPVIASSVETSPPHPG